jgi:hypothetical protein
MEPAEFARCIGLGEHAEAAKGVYRRLVVEAAIEDEFPDTEDELDDAIACSLVDNPELSRPIRTPKESAKARATVKRPRALPAAPVAKRARPAALPPVGLVLPAAPRQGGWMKAVRPALPSVDEDDSDSDDEGWVRMACSPGAVCGRPVPLDAITFAVSSEVHYVE